MNRRRMLAKPALAGTGMAALGCAMARANSRGEAWRSVKTDHFDGAGFFNPLGPTGNTFANFLKWQRTRKTRPWPAWMADNVPARLPDRVGDREAYVTAINHCTFLIQLPGLNLLTDPVYSERVSPVSFAGPKRIRPPGIPWEKLPRIDAVVISHSHFDHLDLTTLVELHQRFRPKFITGLGNRALIESRAIRDVEEIDWWQTSAATSLAARITFTPAQHWSSRNLIVKNTSLWGGFWIENDGRKLYFAGDSGYGRDFGLIRARLGVPDAAMLPIGAYEPRWFMNGSHLAPDEALNAQRDLGGPRCLAMHFDTFPLADDGYGDAERELVIAREYAGVPAAHFHAPKAGETALVS